MSDDDERADLRRRPESMPRSRIELGFGIGLFVMALALRMVVARAVSGEPVWDGHYYDFGARHIASGFGYADEVMRDGQPVWHMPGSVPDFLDKLGANTGYIIHPEETVADNFALLATGARANNRDLLKRIEALLLEPR